MIEKNIHKSKTFKLILITGSAIVILLGVFLLGITVGFHKASFSYRIGEHYDTIFGGYNRMVPTGFDADDIPGEHEAAGKIISVELPVFVVVGPDNIEKKVEIDSDTVITALRSTASSSSITVGDSAVIIGIPGTNSDIDAKFIRIFPNASTTGAQ